MKLSTALFVLFSLFTVSPILIAADNTVYVNDKLVSQQVLNNLSEQYRIAIQDGRYWVDAQCWCGYENGPALFNLVHLANSARTTFRRNSYTGIGSGSSGSTSYVIGKDFSVIVD